MLFLEKLSINALKYVFMFFVVGVEDYARKPSTRPRYGKEAL